MSRAKITRKWETFAGRNRFYCNGRLMTGPHSGVFVLTMILITTTCTLFFVFDCGYLAMNVTVAIPIIGGVLFLMTMSSLLRTSLTDPGIIPRATLEEAIYVEKQIEVTNSTNSPTFRPPPRTKEVLIKGQTIKLKYCFTCKIFRPPRASHCSLCDNCVDRFDHHCPWVGNCVGRRNYRFFYMFIVSLAFLAVFMFVCAVAHLILISKEQNYHFFEAVKESPPSIIVALMCFFSVWSILGLAGFHTYLTSSDQTTNEDIKGSFSDRSGHENPYSQGNLCLNCLYILCGPMTPSLIDRRGIVTKDNTVQHIKPNMAPFMPPINSYVYEINNLNSTNPKLNQYYSQNTQENAENTNGSITQLIIKDQPIHLVPPNSLKDATKQYTSQPNLTSTVLLKNTITCSENNVNQCDNYMEDEYKETCLSSRKSDLDLDNVISFNDKLDTIDRRKENDIKQLNNDLTEHEKENSILSTSRLRLLQDTTMIESALDLDSLDDPSVGVDRCKALIKVV